MNSFVIAAFGREITLPRLPRPICEELRPPFAPVLMPQVRHTQWEQDLFFSSGTTVLELKEELVALGYPVGELNSSMGWVRNQLTQNRRKARKASRRQAR